LVQRSVDHATYAMRNRIEPFMNRLKNNGRIATRCDHTSTSFFGFVILASIRIWLSFVHAA
jgi:transposase